MRSARLLLLLAAAIPVALSIGCSGRDLPAKELLSDNDVRTHRVAGEFDLAAEKSARIGELLFMPEALEYADEHFDAALKDNPENARANFYSAIIKPVMKFKGFASRIENIVEPNERVKIAKLRKKIEELNVPELARLVDEIPGGKRPFGSFHDVQRFMKEELLPELNSSVAKLDRIKAKDLELRLNLARWGSTSGGLVDYSYSYNCYDTYNPSVGGAMLTGGRNCTFEIREKYNSDKALKATAVKIDAVDIKALRSSVLALIDYIRLTTAYSFEGMEAIQNEIAALEEIAHERGRSLNAKEVIRAIRKQPGFMTLERDHELGRLSKSLPETLRHAVDLAAMEQEICGQNNREGHLFPSVCLGAEMLEEIQTTLDLLAGPKEIGLGIITHAGEIRVLTDVTALLKNPVKDLKALLPTEFDHKGDAIHYPDPTFGGLFPNGDVLDKVTGTALQEKAENLERQLENSADDFAQQL